MMDRKFIFCRQARGVFLPFIGSLDSFVKLLVTIAFAMTLMQYFVNVSYIVGAVLPIALLAVAGFCALIRSERTYFLRNILSGGALLFPFFIFFDIVSYYSGNAASFQYGLLLLVIFVSIRLILLQIRFIGVLHSYINSALFCTAAILISGRRQISDYQVGQVNRFNGGSEAHPNLIGFTLTSYLALFLGVYLDTSAGIKRYVIISAIGATLFTLFLAGSRGSLLAAIIPFVILFVRFAVFKNFVTWIRLTPAKILAGLGITTAVIIYAVGKGHLASLGHFFVTSLALDSSQRGIHSGFSGRNTIWISTLSRIRGLQLIFGFGYRQAYLVDNGYITVLFDNGILGLVLIVGSIFKLLVWFWRGTSVVVSWGWWRYRVVLLMLVVSYLVNSITARYLFSYGNQFSILMMFMIFSAKSDIMGGPTLRPTAKYEPHLKPAVPIGSSQFS